MAVRVLPPPRTTRREVAGIERVLFAEMRAASLELEEQFASFLDRGDVLLDQYRMAGLEESSAKVASWKAIAVLDRYRGIAEIEEHSSETQKADPLPPEALAAVRRALARAQRYWEDFELRLKASLVSETVRSFEAGAQGPIKQMGFTGTFDLKNPRVLDYLETRANMLAGGISDTTFDAMINTITRGFYVDGKNPLDVARDLRAQFDFLSGYRSRNIARTETLIASESGLYEQHYSIGAEGKQWFSVADDRTRESHLEVNRKIVPIFEPFMVRNNSGGFDEMLHPGDGTASPENVCQCRCGSGAIIETTEASAPWLGD